MSLEITAASFYFLVPGLLADLEVGIPPGTPLDWRYELPSHAPDEHRSPIYTHARASQRGSGSEGGETPPKDAPRGKTVVAAPRPAEVPPPIARFGTFNPLGAARVLTFDITGHLEWTVWKKKDAAPADLGYPPALRGDLYWLLVTALLRPAMHPALVPKAQTAQYLVTVGPPVREALEAAPQLAALDEKLAAYLEKNILPAPREPPPLDRLVKEVEDEELRMLVAWAARELASDHLYAYNPAYARRTLSLGVEAIPVLLAVSRSEHSLLRQNAAGVLASWSGSGEEVLLRLREIARGSDAVARNRAIESLILRRDREAEDLLLGALGGGDDYFRVFAVEALGRMGSARALAPIRKLFAATVKDHGETWLAAAAALSRLADADAESRKVLRRTVRWAAGNARMLDLPFAREAPDFPDRPGDRARLLVETATIALARLGDEPSRKLVVEKLKDPNRERREGKVPQRGIESSRDPVLGGFERYNQLLVIECLPALGPEAADWLKAVVEKSHDTGLRAYALAQLLRRGGEDAFVLTVAKSDPKGAVAYPSVLRVQAMEGLAREAAGRKSALDAAREMVDAYLGVRPGGQGGGRLAARGEDSSKIPAYECLAAVRLLGRHDPLPAAMLERVLNVAKVNGDFERLTEDKEGLPAPPGGAAPGGKANQVSLKAYPPLFEAVVVELGRLGQPSTYKGLERVLADRSGPGRPEAALALGNLKVREACDVLLGCLGDADPWVRYSAYRSLKEISGASHFADWIFASPKARDKALQAWREWRKTKGEELPKAEDLPKGGG
jgi:HEAT repeat protein